MKYNIYKQIINCNFLFFKLLLSLTILIASTTTATGQLCGDVNENGSVDILDALLISRYYVELIPSSSLNLLVADVNNDLAVNIIDSLIIARYYVDLVPAPVCLTTTKPPTSLNFPYAPYIYPNGVGSVSQNQDNDNTLIGDVCGEYSSWKEHYITSENAAGFLRVKWPDAIMQNCTTSSGIGYGMLLAVYMDDIQLLNALWNYAIIHLNRNGLMIKEIDATGLLEGNSGSQADADIDIATALIFASRKWGIYGDEARFYLENILTHEIEATTNILKPGNINAVSTYINPSYFGTASMKIFADFTGNQRWLDIRTKCYDLLNLAAHPVTGLVPDWCRVDGTPGGGPGSRNPDKYYYDACRTPFRISLDYLWFGDLRAKDFCNKIGNFFAAIGNGDVSRILNGYHLNGQPIGGITPYDVIFIATAGSAGMTAELFDFTKNILGNIKDFKINQFYQGTIRLFCLLQLTGNLPDLYSLYSNPVPQPTPDPVISSDCTPEPTLLPCTPINTLESKICPGGNLLRNGCFDMEMIPWMFTSKVNADCARDYTCVKYGGSGAMSLIDGALHISINEPGAISCAVQVVHNNVEMLLNHSYSLSFDARSDSPRPISINIAHPNYLYNSYLYIDNQYGEQRIELDCEWETYTIDFMNLRDSIQNAQFQINTGKYPGDVYIDNIILTKKTEYSINSEIIPPGSGIIEFDPVSPEYEPGTTVILTAIPLEGYKFILWQGDVNNTDMINTDMAKATVLMDSNKKVIAVFSDQNTIIHRVTTNVIPEESGNIMPVAVNAVAGETLLFTAIPHAGFRFDRWEGDYTGTQNPLELTVNGDTTITAVFAEKLTWTALIHFAVDNSIDYDYERERGMVSNYLSTLQTIEADDRNDIIDILVLMDCYNTDTQANGYISNYQDGYYHLTGGNFNNDIVLTKAEINSGSIAETQAFMDWAILNYPASNYLYSVFNHGSGFDDDNEDGTQQILTSDDSLKTSRGIAFDDSHNDALSYKELGHTTSYLKTLIGKNIDLFYPFACLMGGIELAYEVRNNADYMLASEESFPVEIWSYESLSYILKIPDIDSISLGKIFCDSAYSFFSNPYIDRGFTLSLIDLSKINALYTSLDSYSLAALNNINFNSNKAAFYRSAVNKTHSMKNINDFYYIDLGHYLYFIINKPEIDVTVKTAATTVKTDLQNAVLYHRNYYYNDTSGLSIFHNKENSYYSYPITTYQSILSFATNNWVDYLLTMENLASRIAGDAYEPDNSLTNATILNIDAATQNHTIHTPNDYDYYLVTLEAEILYNIKTFYTSGNLLDTQMYLFNSAQQRVSYNDDGDTIYSHIIYTCIDPGIHYILINSKNGDTGDYSINIETSSPISPDLYEPDDSYLSANQIMLDTVPQNHSLHTSTDIDWLYFSAELGHFYSVQASSPNNDILDIHFYAENNYTVQIDSGYIGSNITFPCYQNGNYYIKISSYMDRIGDYSIKIQTGLP